MPRLYSIVVATFLVASGAASGAANPFGSFFYTDTGPNAAEAYENIAAYKVPTAMLLTGECNRTHAHFAQARAAGAEVLAYMNPIERIDGNTPCSTYQQLYTMPNGQLAPLWPFPTPGSRVNWAGTHMLDVRAGSAWADRFVAAVEDLMRDDNVDGVFLDVVGARLWSVLADWNNTQSPGVLDWTQAERDAWTQGNVDLVRRLDASRLAINPRFIIVSNSTWDFGGSGLPVGSLGEPYVDGIVLQNPTFTQQHRDLALRPYANRGHNRFIVTLPNVTEEDQWVDVPGVTHTTSQPDWGSVDTPAHVVPAHRLLDRPKKFGRTSIAQIPSAGMTADRKRASKFTMPETGRLTELIAYVDGLGGASGSQQVQLVLYRDNNGVPGAKVAASAPRSLASGDAGTWRAFTVANLPLLIPGNYWIAIHTGGTAQVLRNFGDGAANWYGNDDVFADGATDPFGGGSAGTVELSVHAKYVVGQ
jgi:hypothetical protein